MPRRNVERETGGYCKIRKRVSSSYSPADSSSSVRNYRLKRAILVAKRKGPSTPLPTWKMALRSPSVAKLSPAGDKGEEAQMSARRLAAHLWEFNGGAEEEKENCKGTHTPVCKREGSKKARHRRRSSEKLQLIEYVGEGKDSVHHGASVKVGSHSAVNMAGSIAVRLKDVRTGLTTSKELVKVLFRMWSQEEPNSSSLNLVSVLRVEIDRARHQVDQLMHEKRYSQREIDALLKQFASDKADWKSKEQDRISNAVSSVARELEVERKLRRQTERLNKTLGRELADTKAQLDKAVEELGCERRAREILEKTCDELASGLGNDRDHEVEALKRECDQVREETEREKQMLQLADVLREERVQMKLADARYEYEEKNAALERLRSELEAYLGGNANARDSNGEKRRRTDGEVEEDGGEDLGEGELDSIELSMGNLSKSYNWSFANEGSAADSRRASVEEMFKGRRSLCEKIQWENICLQRKTKDGIDWDFTMTNNSKRKSNANGFDKGRLSDASSSQGERNDHRSIKGREDQVLLSSSSGGNASAGSRPQSPPEVGDSKTSSVDSGDRIDGNNDGRNLEVLF